MLVKESPLSGRPIQMFVGVRGSRPSLAQGVKCSGGRLGSSESRPVASSNREWAPPNFSLVLKLQQNFCPRPDYPRLFCNEPVL